MSGSSSLSGFKLCRAPGSGARTIRGYQGGEKFSEMLDVLAPAPGPGALQNARTVFNRIRSKRSATFFLI